MTQDNNIAHINAKAALEALGTVRDSRAEMLAKMDYWPWWYDVGYAAACGMLVAAQGIKAPLSLGMTSGAIAILLLIMRKWQAETGVWVNGYSPKRARWAAFGLVAILMGLIGLSVAFGRLQGIAWVPVVCGLVAAACGVVGMRIWMMLYRKDMAASA